MVYTGYHLLKNVLFHYTMCLFLRRISANFIFLSYIFVFLQKYGDAYLLRSLISCYKIVLAYEYPVRC
jgi:hypothetical protein